MGNYENLKQSITEVIRTNGNHEITGSVLQSTLLTIISTVGANATFAGIATPATNPGTPDQNVFYLAGQGGTYTNFGNIELQDGLSVLTLNNSSWSSQQIFDVDDVPTAGSDNLVTSDGVAKNTNIESASFIVDSLFDFPQEKEIINVSTANGLCTFKGEIWNERNSKLVINSTSDANVMQSDFIPLDNILHIESNSNALMNDKFPAILCFATASPNSYLGSIYGEESLYENWKKIQEDVSDIEMPLGTKFIVVQINRSELMPETFSFTCKVQKKKLDILEGDVYIKNVCYIKQFCKNAGAYYISGGSAIYNPSFDDLVNSGMIRVPQLKYVMTNNTTNNAPDFIPAILYFDVNKNFISCQYGEEKQLIGNWYEFSDIPNIPVNAAYAVVQCNIADVLTNNEYRVELECGIRKTEEVCGNKGAFVDGEIVDTPDTAHIYHSDLIPCENVNEVVVIQKLNYYPIIIYYDYFGNYISSQYEGYGNIDIDTAWKIIFARPSIPNGAKYMRIQTNINIGAFGDNSWMSIYYKKNNKNLPSIISNIPKVYNVRNYGALGDGVNDDTCAIQAAIDDCFAHGGGDVYFPNGVYRLDSVRTIEGQTNHLFIPMSEGLAIAKSIRLIGESSNLYRMYVPFNGIDGLKPVKYGACLYSTYTPNSEYLTSPISVIGSAPNDEYITKANATRLYVERLNIFVKLGSSGYPLVSGINALRISQAHINNVMISSDSAPSDLSAPPANHISFGFAGCCNLCDPPQTVENVNICGGFQYGIVASEHLIAKGVDIQTCINAFAFGGAYHPNYLSLVSCHNCKNQIIALDRSLDILSYSGHSVIVVESLDIECNMSIVPTGFNYEHGIVDASNKLYGKVSYLMVNGAGATPTGLSNEHWNVVGGGNLVITPIYNGN